MWLALLIVGGEFFGMCLQNSGKEWNMCAPEQLALRSEFVSVLKSLLGTKILRTFPLAIWKMSRLITFH